MARGGTAETIVEHRWPEVASHLRAAPPLEIHADQGPAGTWRVNGLHITSAVDRTAEAELQAERISISSPRAFVYGLALGDLPRVLLARPHLERLTVVVLNPSLARESITRFQHPWLSDPRVQLEVGRDHPRVQSPFAVAPACVALASDPELRLRDLLHLELAKPYQSRKHAERESMIQESMARNQPRLQRDPDVATLYGTRPGARAVVAAGGPTLTHGLPWLQRHRTEVLTVAVGTALRPLQTASITPDVAVVVDPKPSQLEHFRPLHDDPLREVPLVYVPAVQPAVVERWPGPRLAAYLDQPRYAALRTSSPRGTLFCAGTVTHTAVDLAVRMGAAEIVLMGADFAYPHQRSHAVGTAFASPVPASANLTALSGRGGRIPTDLSMVGFLRDLEAFIARHPQVLFRNASQEGAHIAGTSPHPELAE